MSSIFISHAFSADPIRHAQRVAEIARELSLSGHLPLAPQIYLPQFLDETTERDHAPKLCLALVKLSGEVRVYGMPTEGMRLEIAEARRLGIPIVAGDREAETALAREPSR